LGLQIGVEGVDLVMIFQGDKGMQAVALRQVSAWSGRLRGSRAGWTPCNRRYDWKLNTEILTYSRAKGTFAGLTLTGADIAGRRFHRHSTGMTFLRTAFWGRS